MIHTFFFNVEECINELLFYITIYWHALHFFILFCSLLFQTAKGAKIFSAAVAATADGPHHSKEGDEKIKMHTHSYCSLDYAQVSFLYVIFMVASSLNNKCI